MISFISHLSDPTLRSRREKINIFKNFFMVIISLLLLIIDLEIGTSIILQSKFGTKTYTWHIAAYCRVL